MTADDEVSRVTARYPTPEMTAAEFEEFAASLFQSADQAIPGLVVQLHEKIEGTDGAFDFDATVRFEISGVSILVLVEAKMHKNPIKHSLLRDLYSKQLSVGAHKSVMISTAPYQKGAVRFAQAHGISLITVTEGRFTVEFRSDSSGCPIEPPTREQAAAFGVPTFVGHRYNPTYADAVEVTEVSPDNPESVVDLLLGAAGRRLI